MLGQPKMSETRQVNVMVSGAVMEVVMARPPVNAINLTLSRQMYDAFKRLNEDDSLRVGLLYSEGNAKNIFSAGWDMKAFAAGESQNDETGFDGPGGLGGLPEYFGLYKPVVVAVAGGAIGGGFELALGGDVIVCSEDAYFWLPEMQRGFLPDGGAIQKWSTVQIMATTTVPAKANAEVCMVSHLQRCTSSRSAVRQMGSGMPQ
mgnify:CR=1 FL=1